MTDKSILAKTYNPKEVEENGIDFGKMAVIFISQSFPARSSFCIVMPPKCDWITSFRTCSG